ncbi:MAG TPA: hypothetical protein PLM22_03510 [Candidatus Sabulitectum sp.]|nr:hypothetical protein [Candidatus Sabulitectum sp.]HPF31723.1 hypothetical protein [Candidatus Sabulitectum sp.]HPJ27975.1 hypothetical protein [Candidatus Sabulitectum sp.]HPR21778.1 hypothetical protein [Candidatus Sabulitectum sp.]
MIIPVFIAALLCGTVPGSIEEILDTQGVFSFTDGSSIYSFFSDGDFLMEPAGLSGRAIEGSWTSDDYGEFSVEGLWTWYNGISQENDRRRMTVLITLLPGEPDTLESLWQGEGVTVYKVYFTVEELLP